MAMRRGTRVGQAHVDVTVDGSGINKEIVDGVDDAGPGVEKAGDEHGKRYGDKFSEGFKGRISKMLGERLGLKERMERAGEESGDSFSRRMADKTKGLGTKIGDRLAIQISDSLGDRIEMALANALNDVESMLDRTRQVSRNAPRLRQDNGLDDVVGSLFGKGSRNNALNLLGSMMKNVVGLVMEGEKFAKGFAKGIGDAAEDAGILTKLLGGLKGGGGATSIGSGLMSIAKGGPAAIAAIVAVIGVMSMMISVTGALLAIVTALASTITSALVGAFLVLAPAITAAAVAGGLLTAAFMSMTDAQQALLSDAFKPLHEELIGIGQLMITQMIPYFDTWSGNLQRALALAVPVASQLGTVFGQAGAQLSASLSGPGFQRFSQALAVWLPGIVLRLSSALGNFLNGVAGSFAALTPLVSTFATYLDRVAARFSAWANSTAGQNAIADFADRAIASLQSLWNFVREFSGAVFDLLFDPNAQAAGNSIFDSLADTFARLREKLAQASADGSLKKWFDDAIKFGSQLWAVISALLTLFTEFYDSGVLSATGDLLGAFASALNLAAQYADPLIGAVSGLTLALSAMLDPIDWVIRKLGDLTDKAGGALNVLRMVPVVGGWVGIGASASANSKNSGGYNPLNNLGQKGNGLGVLMSNQNKGPTFPNIDIASLIRSGTSALNATSKGSGGYKPEAQWKNPYVAYANSLIKDGPTVSATIRNAINTASKQATAAVRKANDSFVKALRAENKRTADAIRKISNSTDPDSVVSALTDLISNNDAATASAVAAIRASARSTVDAMKTNAQNVVNTARSALNSAAQALANATTPAAAKKALQQVHKAERDLAVAEKALDRINKKAKGVIDKAVKNAENLKKRNAKADKILQGQTIVTPAIVQGLLNGGAAAKWASVFATLADYATAREFIAGELEKANQRLADAMQIRDDYRKQISDSVKSFGALTTAQAKVINGVEQALTATDITDNLQDRLNKIKTFQSNLQILLAQGLSNDAYQQILAQGVEGGSAFAQALVNGGVGAVSQVNNLTSQIGGIADSLGLQASNRLYQAGVDAAQGLVDGLTSLDAELEAAANALGERIAASVKKALGIKSPSTVLIGMMDYVGDGAVIGLDNQGDKLIAASERFSRNIAVSPEVAAYAASQGQSPTVSGNGPVNDIDIQVVTPTSDPRAVAVETVNELVGRL